ncbi:hypothetical protein HMPREF1624_07789 [Sporothrix schenckii ATCC 58251]|uniref:Blue (type 1) copper domain-containing protein n=1 Tax=Sporothrix schenckii (strain ATCC 58251 / de Perez 2211183) TaxID=1391915 RepID=U7PLT7_SPOS1|nr:hypothetical protein HMPREF1624_07789 [Sporothrix schenckii ATCC 58251]
MQLLPLAFVLAGVAMAGFVHADADTGTEAGVARRATATTPTETSPSTFSPTVAPGGLSAAPSTVPTHTIAVGATGFSFTPNNLTVAVGSILEFNFYPGNHSVVRSAFKFPCIPYEDSGPNRVGFFSGYLDTNVYSPDGPKFRVRVNDTEPIFYYCSAPTSCISHGMLGVINPNATWTFQVQQEYAANTTIQLAPGDHLPSEMAPTSAGGPGATGAPGAGSSTPSSGLSSGAVAGVVIGSIAGVIALAGLGIFVFFCMRRSRSARWPQERHRRLAGHGYRNENENGGGSGSGSGSMGNALSPLSPSPGAAVGTPPGQQQHVQFHRPYPYGQSPLHHPSSYSPPLPTAGTGHAHLPIYNSMSTMATLSPLQSHPTHPTHGTMGALMAGGGSTYSTYSSVVAQQGSPSPYSDKAYYRTPPPLPAPTPPHNLPYPPHLQPQPRPHPQQQQHQQQQQQPAPVELPTSAATPVLAPYHVHDGGLRPPPPAPAIPRAESPTIGDVGQTWAKEDEATELTRM